MAPDEHAPFGLKRAVFCDFNGTISQEETFVGMCYALVPDLAAQVLPEVMARRITVRQGLRQLIQALPLDAPEAARAFVREKPARAGLPELLNFLDSQGVPFFVVSGGLRIMVEEMLGPLVSRCRDVFALDLGLSPDGQTLVPVSPCESASDLVAKEEVLLQVAPEEAVVIGDGITDLAIARRADLVFARDSLCGLLDECGKEYTRWEDFHSVRKHLALVWDV
jgi:2-hydroxy-3-keto-5-methylthiopentenyl-1-phosphate phosphatase